MTGRIMSENLGVYIAMKSAVIKVQLFNPFTPEPPVTTRISSLWSRRLEKTVKTHVTLT